MNFYMLKAPENATFAEWEPNKVKLQKVICPLEPRHQRSGKRLMNLSLLLPGSHVLDFSWTWYNECLLRDETLTLMREAGLTGFDVLPVIARFKRSAEAAPRLWELRRTGWGGMASPASGIKADESTRCSGCGKLKYTPLMHPEQLIDETQWDGSDFFLLWPIPAFPFVTQKVVDFLQTKKLKGVQVVPLSEIKFRVPGFGPGRLSYWMPEDRAEKIGGPLGIA